MTVETDIDSLTRCCGDPAFPGGILGQVIVTAHLHFIEYSGLGFAFCIGIIPGNILGQRHPGIACIAGMVTNGTQITADAVGSMTLHHGKFHRLKDCIALLNGQGRYARLGAYHSQGISQFRITGDLIADICHIRRLCNGQQQIRLAGTDGNILRNLRHVAVDKVKGGHRFISLGQPCADVFRCVHTHGIINHLVGVTAIGCHDAVGCVFRIAHCLWNANRNRLGGIGNFREAFQISHPAPIGIRCHEDIRIILAGAHIECRRLVKANRIQIGGGKIRHQAEKFRCVRISVTVYILRQIGFEAVPQHLVTFFN